MRKLSFLVLLTALVFVFPFMALSWEDEPEVNSDGGTAEALEAGAVAPTVLKDERVLALENEYSTNLHALWKEIQDESDPFEREHLQKEVERIKTDQEMALTALYLEIAVEQGDEDRVMQLQEVLDQLYEPKVAEPSDQEPQPLPNINNKRTQAPSKTPDDA